jgi:hypothetical protein
VNSTTTILKARVLISGAMPENMLVPGEIIKWKEREPSNGLTEDATLVSSLMTRNTDLENITGPTNVFTKETGETANRMEMEPIPITRGLPSKEFGEKEKGQIGKTKFFYSSVLERNSFRKENNDKLFI